MLDIMAWTSAGARGNLRATRRDAARAARAARFCPINDGTGGASSDSGVCACRRATLRAVRRRWANGVLAYDVHRGRHAPVATAPSARPQVPQKKTAVVEVFTSPRVAGARRRGELHPVRSAETTVNVAWPSNGGLLKSHLYSPNQMFVRAMVYEPLARYQPDGSIGPWLATARTISPDGRVCTFMLRLGGRFCDGVPFSAEVVKKNFDAVLANAARHAILKLIAQIERLEVVDSQRPVLRILRCRG
jgi:hypothetical protein